MKILALDLGKFKTVACFYVDGEAEFATVETGRPEFTALLTKHRADVVVFETCTAAGWLADLCEELLQPFFVANPNGEAWRWCQIKRKTDRDDALKLARLTAMDQLPTVHVPSRAVWAKRSLPKFRQSVVGHADTDRFFQSFRAAEIGDRHQSPQSLRTRGGHIAVHHGEFEVGVAEEGLLDGGEIGISRIPHRRGRIVGYAIADSFKAGTRYSPRGKTKRPCRSNSIEPSLRAAIVAFQPALPRVVTSASPASRFSVRSLTLIISTQVGRAYVPVFRYNFASMPSLMVM